MSCERLPTPLEFTKHFFREGKPVAAICHAPWVLIDAGVVRGRKINVVEAHSDQCEKCRWQLGERRSGGGQRTLDQSQARRHSRVQREDDGGILRRETRKADAVCRGGDLRHKAQAVAENARKLDGLKPSSLV